MYGAINLEAAEAALDTPKSKWEAKYPGAVKVWVNNFNHVSQLFNYPSDIRRMMYTTNAIESVNSSLRKFTKKGMFENEDAVFKFFISGSQENWPRNGTMPKCRTGQKF